MNIKKLFKRAVAFVMAAVTVLSALPATTAFAATGDVGTISFTRTYDSDGNIIHYNSSAVINGYTAGGTGSIKYRMYVDGSNAFCLQPGVPLKTGNTLVESASETWNALSASQQKAVGLALLYGYQGNRDNLTGSDDEKWLATQTLVWEFVTGCRSASAPYEQTSSTIYSLHFDSNYPNEGARAAYEQIVSMLNRHKTVPSFMNGGSRELEYKDGRYTLTLTDTNGVLSEYDISVSNRSVSVEKSGNTLTLSSAKAFTGFVRVTANRNNIPIVSDSAKLIAYGDPDLQDLITGVENAEPVSAYLDLETPTGSVALTVTKSDVETGSAQGNASLAGAVYGVYKGDQLIDSYTTDEKGQFTTGYYVCGDDWSIREISPSEGYLLDDTSYHVGAEPKLYTVEYNLTANDVTEQVIKGKIALIKHTDDGETQLETPEAGAEFAVYLKSAGSYDASKDTERDYLINTKSAKSKRPLAWY